MLIGFLLFYLFLGVLFAILGYYDFAITMDNADREFGRADGMP